MASVEFKLVRVFVTTTSFRPTVLAPVVQVRLFAVATTTGAQAWPPILIEVCPAVKKVPVIVRFVPPAIAPALAERAVTVGLLL